MTSSEARERQRDEFYRWRYEAVLKPRLARLGIAAPQPRARARRDVQKGRWPRGEWSGRP